MPAENKTISFKNVSFSYTADGKEILKNISFEVQPGEKIALIGHNGAGKTTLVKLLLRLYDPTSGSITLDGRDIKEYKVSSYRKYFGAVFQHFKVFSMSVMENILLKGNITESEKTAALEGMKNSGVYAKVMSLDKKENTVLTKEFDENGTVFSGGENQKIAIARVFAKPCNFVIMDEPSSALDPIAEYKMYEAMMKACRDKSVIYISHRLSSAVLADRVYLMENGEIVESGTHTELLQKDGKYADMWRKQSEQYQKGVEIHA
ncbi:MAG: ATP-binding cassette domain-containing protein [Clostridia bacterium]|nr:ATP-binding cassette domain-containing protein [Clostridia bacterium]